MTQIHPNIQRIVIPYKDIFTTVYILQYKSGVLVFDAAADGTDVDGYIVPALEELKLAREDVKYIFISHDHRDHSGGLPRLLEHCPNACVLSCSQRLKERLGAAEFIMPQDGQRVDDVFQVVTIPGHTADSMALLDERTNTLVTGDCLQLYGIFGSTDWACAITLPEEHFQALNKVRAIQVDEILTAHDYHPCGCRYVGHEAVEQALDACAQPLEEIRQIIRDNADMDDEMVRETFNAKDCRPTVSTRIVGFIRKALDENRL